jgi:tRNA(fMet)-specific endonuclease VapC
MGRAILDTDILSEILKGRDPNVHARMSDYLVQHARLTFTSVTVLEIVAGYRKRDAFAQALRADQLFKQNDEIVPDADDYRLAAEIVGGLLKAGRVIGIIDPLISACAIRRNLDIVSGNTLHFEFIRTLGYEFGLLNWRT